MTEFNVTPNPVEPFLKSQGSLILDGGLATELEQRGFDLNDPLWSGRLLIEQPEAIQAVHAAYLAAGADCLISASYQVTLPGLMARGVSEAEAVLLLARSVSLATAARERFWRSAGVGTGRLTPLVAASIGPYGAYLADGSEYDGRYGLSRSELAAFHAPRWRLLAASAADLMACETIPAFLELQALTDLLAEQPRWSWFSFSCADGAHLHDGTPIERCGEWLAERPFVAAVGVNCTAPRFIGELVRRLQAVTDLPIVVYPNSGERYDADNKKWLGQADAADFARAAADWSAAGAQLIGGCCRTGPEHIARLRALVI